MNKDVLIAQIKSYATDGEKQETLLDLMAAYNVNSLDELTTEQCHEFAVKLIGGR